MNICPPPPHFEGHEQENKCLCLFKSQIHLYFFLKVSSETEAFLKRHWIKDNENINGDKSKVEDENCNNKDKKGDELSKQAATKTFAVPSATSKGKHCFCLFTFMNKEPEYQDMTSAN